MKRAYWVIIACAILLAVWAAVSHAGEFSADFKQFVPWEEEDAREKTGKIYFKDGASRMEFLRGGQTAEIVIINPKKKKAWMLNREDKTYMEIRFTDQPWPLVSARDGMTEKKLGRETVAGYACEKTLYSSKDEPDHQTIVWMSPKLGYPVKWEQASEEGKSTFALTAIREALLKDTLFLLPKGYRNIADEEETANAEPGEENEAAKVVKDDAKDIASDAKGAAKDEVSDIVTDSVREGIRGLFKK